MIRPSFSQVVLERSRPPRRPSSTLVSLPPVCSGAVAYGPGEHRRARSEADQTFAPGWDEPHAGSPDLGRFPVSLVEQHLAGEIIAGVDRYVELLEVAGSTARALGVLFVARGDLAGCRS